MRQTKSESKFILRVKNGATTKAPAYPGRAGYGEERRIDYC